MKNDGIVFEFGFQTNSDAYDWVKENALGPAGTMVGVRSKMRWEFYRIRKGLIGAGCWIGKVVA